MAGPVTGLSLWRNRDYLLLWSGQAVSTTGSAASGIVFPILILDITGSAAAAGLAGALAALPYVFFSLTVGALIDRWDRKRVMILCDAGRALNMASIPLALAFGSLTIWQLYANSFIEGTLFVFFSISQSAALPRVVAKEQLPNAVAQNIAADTVAYFVGPSLGTLLYQGFSRMAPFVVDAVSYAVSVLTLSIIRTPFQAERTAAPGRLRTEIMEGLRWLWHNRLIRFMSFLGSSVNLVDSSLGLILIVLAKGMGAPDGLIGIIFTIGAAGGFLGSLVSGRIQRRFSFGQVIVVVVWINALLLPLYTVAPNIWALGAITAVSFGISPVYDVVQYSYRLAIIPDQLQGRVNSSFRLIAWSSRPLGQALTGVLLEQFGGTVTVLFFFVCMLVVSVIVTLNSHVRNAPRIEAAGEGA